MKRLWIWLALSLLCLALTACDKDKFSVVSADILAQLEGDTPPVALDMTEILAPLHTFPDGTISDLGDGEEFFTAADGRTSWERGGGAR